jgi:DNA invertase Pin-like site-specific DNA recombinase
MAESPSESRIRAVGIARQSVAKDGSKSPEQQIERMQAFCDSDGMDLLKVFTERDVSGGTPIAKRAGLRKAVEMVENGDADVIIGAYFDRLMRSLQVQAELVTRVEAVGGRVLALDTGQITNGSAGQWLSGTLLGTVAEYHRRTTSERVRDAQRAKVEAGVVPFPGYFPGYKRERGKVLQVIPAEATVVEQGFAIRAEGATIADVADLWLAHGLAVDYRFTHRYLANRIVLGEIHFGKYKNLQAHEPIIDAGTFKRVQETVVARGRPAKSDRLLARLGVLLCGSCGARMVANRGASPSHDRPQGHVPFYVCPDPKNTCPRRVTITATITEEAVWNAARNEARVQGRADPAVRAREAAAKADELETVYANLVDALTGREHVGNAKVKLDEAQTTAEAARAVATRLQSTHAAVTVDVDDPRLTRDDRRGIIRRTIASVRVAPSNGLTGAERLTVELFVE